MRSPDFTQLESTLLDLGIARRHASRLCRELDDHFCDLRDEYVQQGRSIEQAVGLAAEQLGSLDAVVESVRSRPELRSWWFRYPAVGRLALPVACVLALPAAPVIATAEYAPTIARWGVIISLSAVITAAIFLAMQISISLG
ncbi:MAG: permease prefix domain 1-containing protein [Pseudomonadota bacterium]